MFDRMIYYYEQKLTAEVGNIEHIDLRSVATPFLVSTFFGLTHVGREARPSSGAEAQQARTAEPA
jgi:hypothetical protein